MTIRIVMTSFEIFTITGDTSDHNHIAVVPCVMTIGNETINAEWAECMNIINARFPNVAFEGVWTGNVFTMTENGNAPVFITDPACSMFWMEA